MGVRNLKRRKEREREKRERERERERERRVLTWTNNVDLAGPQNSWSRKTNIRPEESKLMKQHLRRLVKGKSLDELESTGFSYTFNDQFEELVIKKPVMFNKESLTIYVDSNQLNHTINTKTKPYARKGDQGAMVLVSPIHITTQGNITNSELPRCQYRHNVPAIVFSFGGFSPNIFHAFNDIIIPLFITSRHFDGQLQFVITDYLRRQVKKFDKVLKKLTRYDLVDADSDETVHCFPAAVVGLRYHDTFALNTNDTPGGHTMTTFRQFLRDSFNLPIKTVTVTGHKKPRLLLLSRRESRKLLNEDEMVKMMERLGFQVQRALPGEMSHLDKFSHTINACDVLVGVHGAGLTNQVFLPSGSVVVQIVPLGLEWASEHYFAKPAIEMGLTYLEYKVWPNETSLYDLYGPDDPIVSDPTSVWAKGFNVVQDVYLKHQDVRVDLNRFKGTLLQVLKLL